VNPFLTNVAVTAGVMATLRSLIHFSFGTPIFKFLYGIPLITSAGLASFWNSLIEPGMDEF